MAKPTGRITRGTTGTNRLRRVDRWITAQPAARVPGALIVDLGFGGSATTPLELLARVQRINPTAELIGLEIDPERVATANAELVSARGSAAASLGRELATSERVSFALGGFEVPTARRPQVIRAMNVLRQYDEHEVAEHWKQMTSRLARSADAGGVPGILVEGTSNETGRVTSFITLDAAGPRTFTIALKLDSLGSSAAPAPSVVAERLPKALIHRNVPGERIHDLLTALDAAWASASAVAAFGATQRWLRAVQLLKEQGWPVQATGARWRLGELSLPWESVAPSA